MSKPLTIDEKSKRLEKRIEEFYSCLESFHNYQNQQIAQIKKDFPNTRNFFKNLSDDQTLGHSQDQQNQDQSQKTKQHLTGAIRSTDTDNVRYDLITPIGLRRVAETYAEGAKKYSDYNWEKGFPITDLLNHAIRHIFEYLSGDRKEDHLAHAAWNLLASIHSEELWPQLNRNLRQGNCSPPVEGAENQKT